VTRIVLIRHGEAAAGWGEDFDPGLSERGRGQAREMAASLEPLGPLCIVTSPLRRCRETAEPLAEQWNVAPAVEADIGEIKAPHHELRHRDRWLHTVLGKTWPELPAEQQAWRGAVLDRLLSCTDDCVLVTHFVAINAAIGAALRDDRVVCRRLGNCSMTTFDTDGRSLELVDVVGEAERTQVL